MNNFKLKIKILSVFVCFGLVFGMQIAAVAEGEGNKGYIVGSALSPQEVSPQEELDNLRKEVAIFSEKIREYYIGLDDVLEISVWRIPELSKTVVVRPDGKISYPLIGDVEVYRLTLTELDNVLTEKLSLYVREPQISVAIKEFGGKKVFVLGQVGYPGTYRFKSNTTIIEIISRAGGFDDKAQTRSVILIRRGEGGKAKLRRINCSSILRRANLSQNINIMPHDIIYVPRSMISAFSQFSSEISGVLDDSLRIRSAEHDPW